MELEKDRVTLDKTDKGQEIENVSLQTSALKTKPELTKNQLKKMKKKEHWERVKADKRKAEKERLKARKRAARERGEELGPTRKSLKHNRMDKSECRMKVAVDCSFDQFMTEKDIKMLVKQIQFCYSANRRAPSPLQLYICSLVGKTKDRMKDLGDYKGWDLHYRDHSFMEEFNKADIVYLSSESPNILQSMEEDKVYVIGGLVDHNHHKGLCHKMAEEKGLYHAQLPISEYLDMKTRKVLTINHVFEILLRFTETNDWQKAFYSVIPQRKGASLKPVLNETDPQCESENKGDNLCDNCSDGIKKDTNKTPTGEVGESEIRTECNSVVKGDYSDRLIEIKADNSSRETFGEGDANS